QSRLFSLAWDRGESNEIRLRLVEFGFLSADVAFCYGPAIGKAAYRRRGLRNVDDARQHLVPEDANGWRSLFQLPQQHSRLVGRNVALDRGTKFVEELRK